MRNFIKNFINLKNKISLAQFNNENYSDYESCLIEIVKIIGYEYKVNYQK